MTDEVLTPVLCKAGRALAQLSQIELAHLAKIGTQTLADFERGARQTMEPNLVKLRVALEKAGVEFIPENGGGAGVRLKKKMRR